MGTSLSATVTVGSGHSCSTANLALTAQSKPSTRYLQIVWTLLVLVLSSRFLVNGQTPGAAINCYEDGLRKLERNDLDGAIEYFSKSIKISSNPASTERCHRASGNSNGFRKI